MLPGGSHVTLKGGLRTRTLERGLSEEKTVRGSDDNSIEEGRLDHSICSPPPRGVPSQKDLDGCQVPVLFKVAQGPSPGGEKPRRRRGASCALAETDLQE